MFEVKKYKLPKFEVVIEAPSFAYESMDGMNIKLKATLVFFFCLKCKNLKSLLKIIAGLLFLLSYKQV